MLNTIRLNLKKGNLLPLKPLLQILSHLMSKSSSIKLQKKKKKAPAALLVAVTYSQNS